MRIPVGPYHLVIEIRRKQPSPARPAAAPQRPLTFSEKLKQRSAVPAKTPPTRKASIGLLVFAVILAALLLLGGGAAFTWYKITHPEIISSDQTVALRRDSFVYDADKYLTYLKNHRDASPVKLHFHTVSKADKKGYTSIGRRYENKAIHGIMGSNPFLKNSMCYVGMEVVVPDRPGVVYVALSGETVSSVIAIFELEDPEEILEFRRLNPSFYGRFKDRQIVFVPNATLPLDLMTEDMRQEYLKKTFFRDPVQRKRISSAFGMRRHPIFKKNRMHNGIDIPAPTGTLIAAAADGKIVFKGWIKGYGKTVRIRHKHGYTTNYGHLHNYVKKIKVGDRIKQGQYIGSVGSTGWSTGPHLDFSIRRHGKPVNPLNFMW